MPSQARCSRIQTFVTTTYDLAPDTSRIEMGARAPLGKLTSRGVDRQKLLAWISAIMVVSRKPLYASGDWALESGHTVRSLREFPGRVRRWADEIQQANEFRLNGIPLLDPERFVAEEWSNNVLTTFFPANSVSHLPSMGAILKRLPDLLRAHSAYLEAQISGIFRENADLQNVPTFEQDLTALFCEFVYESTNGKSFCYEQLADLLTVTYHENGSDRATSADALRKNRERHTTSRRTPKVLGFELHEGERILRVLVEIEAPAIPA